MASRKCPPGCACRKHSGETHTTRARLSRIEDYLLIGGARMSAPAAARRLGVSPRTVVRYRAALRGAS